MKRFLLILAAACMLARVGGAETVQIETVVYGQSEMGRDLVCTVIEPAAFDRTILAVFAMHGFEDEYDRDGLVLSAAAEKAIAHFSAADAPSNGRMIIVACANPDGAIEGVTNSGFGRCNANGIDMNRDFDAAHIVQTAARNCTPAPFSAAESRALRDLVLKYSPDVVLDCHGWLGCTIGDSELAGVFYEEMGLRRSRGFSNDCHGYFSYWAHRQGALALLVEFRAHGFDVKPFLNALDRLAAGDYRGSARPAPSVVYGQFTEITACGLSGGRMITYKEIRGEAVGYADGDVTILKNYDNGWARVFYPTASGHQIAYCPLRRFISEDTACAPEAVQLARDTAVYRRQDLSAEWGMALAGDTIYIVARSGDAVQALCPLAQGGWQLGWIPARQEALAGTEEER